MSINSLFAAVASIVSFVSYIVYIRDVRKGTTKPHVFSWLIWSLMNYINFFAQLSAGGGVGALTSSVTAVMCTYITIFSFRSADKSINRVDWFSFIFSFLAILVWLIVKTPIYSVILITVADIGAFAPTYRKSFHKPATETLSTYLLSSLKHVLVIISLENINFISAFYNFYLFFANLIFVVVDLIRQKQVYGKIKIT